MFVPSCARLSCGALGHHPLGTECECLPRSRTARITPQKKARGAWRRQNVLLTHEYSTGYQSTHLVRIALIAVSTIKATVQRVHSQDHSTAPISCCIKTSRSPPTQRKALIGQRPGTPGYHADQHVRHRRHALTNRWAPVASFLIAWCARLCARPASMDDHLLPRTNVDLSRLRPRPEPAAVHHGVGMERQSNIDCEGHKGLPYR